MPKINVYLPDELADAVRETGLPVSPICQRALEHAVRRITTIRQAVLSDLDPDRLSERLPSFTGRLIITLTLAARRAQEAGAATVTTADLLHGLLAENHNLGVQILTAMDVAPDSLTAPSTPEPDSGGSGLRFSAPAAVALELAVGEAIGFGHNYVGCEHLLVGLAAEPDGSAGELLRSRAVDGKAARRAVAAAVAGYAHLRSTAPDQQAAPAALLTAVRAELTPLIERIERLESRLN
ncbi:ATP-dependent Clp protease ATP-binding subunit ClpC [Actinoplanes lutulentus]|uniref:ATP-dependent Clp protease ATP-binding subunit ClpC n=1 Tax=Actinoplanes lutulentus TaxID=1287878 RepID=A0A327Z393_9ACTN|nr:Clp protease N-terminal domain-containing protein [Actinoplanes lutulentus]MBB2942979.1 ATP-dependent Clp protease ATP-binding subunit ClpC [Actinoplanes lutulentus]RAK26753.1 ATP-dependent Clp protease ATP-binding subunit ClpC [Actinoplanes lutulentus]